MNEVKIKINIYSLAIILLFFLVTAEGVNCETSRSNNIYYDFANVNGHYTLNARIFINSDIPTIINLLYEFNNVKRFFQHAESTEIISQTQNHYDMKLLYKYWIFRADVVYRRTLSTNKKRIYFKMISFKTNSVLLPEVVSSEGYYEFASKGSGVLLTLHNDTILKSYLPVLDSLLMRKEDAFTYLENVKNYAEKKGE